MSDIDSDSDSDSNNYSADSVSDNYYSSTTWTTDDDDDDNNNYIHDICIFASDSTKETINDVIKKLMEKVDEVEQISFFGPRQQGQEEKQQELFLYSLKQLLATGAVLLPFEKLTNICFSKYLVLYMSEANLILEIFNALMQNSYSFETISFTDIIMSNEAISTLCSKQVELKDNPLYYPTTMTFHECIGYHDGIFGMKNSFVSLSCKNGISKDALFATFGKTIITPQDVQAILDECRAIVSPIDTFEHCDFECTNTMISIEALCYLLELLTNKENQSIPSINVLNFLECTICIPSLDWTEEMPNFDYVVSINSFQISKLSTIKELSMLSQIIRHVMDASIEVDAVEFHICTLSLSGLQDFIFDVTNRKSLSKINQAVTVNHEISNTLKRIEYNFCSFTSSTTTTTAATDDKIYEYHGKIHINLHIDDNNDNNFSLIVPPSNGIIDRNSLKAIMDLMAHYAPFINISSLTIPYIRLEDGLADIAKYINQTKLKKLSMCVAFTNLGRGEFKSLVRALKTNTTLTELFICQDPYPSKKDLLALLDIVKRHGNTTLKNVFVDSGQEPDIIIQNEIDYFTGLNRIGCDKLLKIALYPLLFPFVLEKGNDNASLIYWVLQSFPDLFLSSRYYCQERLSLKRKRDDL